eukprot:Nk52_evm28s2356 gene=Nk52_evmTU28s2356
MVDSLRHSEQVTLLENPPAIKSSPMMEDVLSPPNTSTQDHGLPASMQQSVYRRPVKPKNPRVTNRPQRSNIRIRGAPSSPAGANTSTDAQGTTQQRHTERRKVDNSHGARGQKAVQASGASQDRNGRPNRSASNSNVKYSGDNRDLKSFEGGREQTKGVSRGAKGKSGQRSRVGSRESLTSSSSSLNSERGKTSYNKELHASKRGNKFGSNNSLDRDCNYINNKGRGRRNSSASKEKGHHQKGNNFKGSKPKPKPMAQASSINKEWDDVDVCVSDEEIAETERPTKETKMGKSDERKRVQISSSSSSSSDSNKGEEVRASGEKEGKQRKRNEAIVKIHSNVETDQNPEPETKEEVQLIFEEYLSEERLRKLSGCEKLEDVDYLELKVDTSDNTLGNFGTLLPNMTQLKVSGSYISSVRDLGSSLSNLTVLWMAKCGLSDLDGISSLSNIVELYLAFNELSDLGPLTMLDNLQLVDVEGNNVSDISQVEFLSLCSSLTSLTLEDNPVTKRPTPISQNEGDIEEFDLMTEDPEAVLSEEIDDSECAPSKKSPIKKKASKIYDYRAEVIQRLPKLEFLDDVPVSRSKPDIFTMMPRASRAEIRMHNLEKSIVLEGIKYGTSQIQDWTDTVQQNRPKTAAFTRHTPSRPSSASQRPRSAQVRPTTAPPTSDHVTHRSPAANSAQDSSSSLTHGDSSAICGNPARALKERRRNTSITPTASHSPDVLQVHP